MLGLQENKECDPSVCKVARPSILPGMIVKILVIRTLKVEFNVKQGSNKIMIYHRKFGLNCIINGSDWLVAISNNLNVLLSAATHQHSIIQSLLSCQLSLASIFEQLPEQRSHIQLLIVKCSEQPLSPISLNLHCSSLIAVNTIVATF